VTEFTIEHLEPARFAEAWPVVRMSLARGEDAWWQSEAQNIIGRGGGVLAARGPDGSVHGIATYEPARNQRAGCVLSVEKLITVELSRKAPCRNALCQALDLLSLALGCHGVTLPLPNKGYLQHRARGIYGGPSPACA